MHDPQDEVPVTLEQLLLDRMDQFEARLVMIEENILAAITKLGTGRSQIEIPTIATDEITPSISTSTSEWIHPTHLERLIAIDRKLINKIQLKSVPGCWIWIGTLAANGSPSVQIHDRKDGRLKRKLARRWFFEQFFPDVLRDERLAGMPECNENLCVNPFHAASQGWFDTLLKKYDVDRYQLPFVIDASTAYNPKDPYKTIINPGIPERPAPPERKPSMLEKYGHLLDQATQQPSTGEPPPAAPIEEERLQPDWDALMDLNEDDPKR